MHEGDKPSPWRLPRTDIEPDTGQVACAAHDRYLCSSPAEADAPTMSSVGPLWACWDDARLLPQICGQYIVTRSATPKNLFGSG